MKNKNSENIEQRAKMSVKFSFVGGSNEYILPSPLHQNM